MVKIESWQTRKDGEVNIQVCEREREREVSRNASKRSFGFLKIALLLGEEPWILLQT